MNPDGMIRTLKPDEKPRIDEILLSADEARALLRHPAEERHAALAGMRDHHNQRRRKAARLAAKGR
jgi:hypothetical protein